MWNTAHLYLGRYREVGSSFSLSLSVLPPFSATNFQAGRYSSVCSSGADGGIGREAGEWGNEEEAGGRADGGVGTPQHTLLAGRREEEKEKA